MSNHTTIPKPFHDKFRAYGLTSPTTKAGIPAPYAGTLQDRKSFPLSKTGHRVKKFPFSKNPPTVLPENKTKFNKWLKFFLGQVGHRVEGLNAFQFEADEKVLKDSSKDLPARHPRQDDFEAMLMEFATFVQIGQDDMNRTLVWPLGGLYTFRLAYDNIGKKKGTASFFLSLFFDCDDDYCLVTNCTVMLELEDFMPASKEGGGVGTLSSSSYLATSSSSVPGYP